MAEHAKYVLVGGGVASVCAAQAIRERDSEGRILMVREEVHVPYDRPPLSKGVLKSADMGLDDASSKYEVFYEENRIERMLGVRATGLDRATKTLTLSNGETVTYEKLLLATGSYAVRPDVPGAETAHVLRTIDDAVRLREAIAGASKVIVVGSGYIGIEVASVCIHLGKEVQMISRDQWPWQSFASESTGHFVAEALRGSGVDIVFNTEIGKIDAKGVETDYGRLFRGDVVVLGTGVLPRVELAEGAGLKVDPDHGILVNDQLATDDPDIYAAGDCAYFEDRPDGLSGEHHLNAKWQGACAGGNMAGAKDVYDRVPYFWCNFLDLSMILRGHPERSRMVRVVGDRAAGEFTELYENVEGELVMGIAFSHDEPSLDAISDKLEAAIGKSINDYS